MSPLPLPRLRQLQYLVHLAEIGHFGRAARELGIGQSTLSAGLKELEQVLGAVLIDRTNRRVVLTALGREVVESARTILRLVEDLTRLARDKGAPLAGELRLGVIPTIGPYLLPRALPLLRKAFPKLKLYLHEDLTGRLVSGLEKGDLDLALLALPCECGSLLQRPLFEDRFFLTLRGDHPLAQRKRLPLSSLRAEKLLLLEDGHCLREQALAACQLSGPLPAASVSATSLLTLVQMADNGLGITLVPEMAIKAGLLSGTDLVTRPLPERGAHRHIGLAWRPGSQRAGEFAALGDCLVRFASGAALK